VGGLDDGALIVAQLFVQQKGVVASGSWVSWRVVLHGGLANGMASVIVGVSTMFV
jgi:hypothetical protein